MCLGEHTDEPVLTQLVLKRHVCKGCPRVSTETGPEALRDVALVTGDKMITANVG